MGAAPNAVMHIEEVGAGAPLVLLHGWGLHSGFFAPVLPTLAAQAQVYAVDLPGHGHSAPLVPYTLDTIVDGLDAALSSEARPLTLLGWSFGGLIAQRYAARYPARIRRLVLVCTTPRLTVAPDWPFGVDEDVLLRFGDELAVAYAATLKRFLTLQMQGASDPRPVLASLRAQLFARGAPDPAALASALHILLGTDLRSGAAALAQPALVVTGGRDTLTPPGAGAWLAQAMPDARLVAIEQAAHIPFLSHPAAFNAALADFLHDNPAS
jgi:pimeloyl-[acyl-carrier protein] methyl ester esterase